jgi:hypothetical protein
MKRADIKEVKVYDLMMESFGDYLLPLTSDNTLFEKEQTL